MCLVSSVLFEMQLTDVMSSWTAAETNLLTKPGASFFVFDLEFECDSADVMTTAH